MHSALHHPLAIVGAWALLLGFATRPVRAGTVTQTVNLTASGSNNNVTNGHTVTVFSLAPSFSKFDPSLGTLFSATFQWTGTGSLVVGGNNEGRAIMSYETSSDTETWNIYGGSTTLNFAVGGSESVLDLTTVTGIGTFTRGTFLETYQLQQGFFPATFSTGPTSATVTLQYGYRTQGDQDAIPEPSTVSYVLPSILALWLLRRMGARLNSR